MSKPSLIEDLIAGAAIVGTIVALGMFVGVVPSPRLPHWLRHRWSYWSDLTPTSLLQYPRQHRTCSVCNKVEWRRP